MQRKGPRSVRDELAERVSLDKTCGIAGHGTSGSGSHRVHRCRRRACQGSRADESGWIRTNPEAFAMESDEATRELNRETNGEAGGTFKRSSEERSG